MDIRDEIEDLAMNFEACHKTLAAMGEETRQHIILKMMRMDYNGSRVPNITARTNYRIPQDLPPMPASVFCGQGRREVE